MKEIKVLPDEERNKRDCEVFITDAENIKFLLVQRQVAFVMSTILSGVMQLS